LPTRAQVEIAAIGTSASSTSAASQPASTSWQETSSPPSCWPRPASGSGLMSPEP